MSFFFRCFSLSRLYQLPLSLSLCRPPHPTPPPRKAKKKKTPAKKLTVAPHVPRVVRVVVSRLVLHLPEEPLDAAAHRVRVVDVDVVVLGVGGLLDERLVDADAAELDVVLRLNEAWRVEGGEVWEAGGGGGGRISWRDFGGVNFAARSRR